MQEQLPQQPQPEISTDVSANPIAENMPQKTNFLGVVLLVVTAVLLVVVGYLFYQNMQLNQKYVQLGTDCKIIQETLEQTESETIEKTSNETDQDTTALSEVKTPQVFLTQWNKKQYTSNGQLVWDIAVPVGTESFENGLIEGYLRLTMPFNDYSIQAELSHPRLGDEPPYPQTMDEWITNVFDNTHAGNIQIPQPVTDHLVTLQKTDDTEVKMLTAYGTMDGTSEQVPVTYVFRWSKYTIGGGMIVPNMMMFKSADNQIVPTETLEIFTKTFVNGVTWLN